MAYLQVQKEWLGLGLKSIEILLLNQIYEFNRNGEECYMTNEQFSSLFGESVSTVKRALDRLEEKGAISRSTTFTEGYGRATKLRTIRVNEEWKGQNEPSKQMEGSKNAMEGSKVDNGRFKSEECKVHNEPIKDNIKENKKENKKNEAAAPQSRDRFKSKYHSDEKIIEFINEEYNTYGWCGAKYVSERCCFWDCDKQAIIKYIEENLAS